MGETADWLEANPEYDIDNAFRCCSCQEYFYEGEFEIGLDNRVYCWACREAMPKARRKGSTPIRRAKPPKARRAR